MSLFRLDASIRIEESVSRRLADVVEEGWRSHRQDTAVTRRDVGLHPLPADAWPRAVAASRLPADRRGDDQQAAAALAEALVDELAAADGYLFAVPLYNFGVPQAFKAWVDLVITDPRMSPGAAPLTANRPAVLVSVRGGGYGPGTPREGWDHGTPWVQRILADVFRLDVRQVQAELTLAPVNPALAPLLPLAEESLRDALVRAGDLGPELAARAADLKVA